jgi:hypothetical protein
MNPEQQRIAIAETCGWELIENNPDHEPYWEDPQGNMIAVSFAMQRIPDYCTDLNAMHEAEKVLESSQEQSYFELLHDIAGNLKFYRSTASQRAEAFLRTLSLWSYYTTRKEN